MKKLESLRAHLLASPLNIKADQLLTFIEKGKVISFQSEDNEHFSLTYSAIIILTEFVGNMSHLAYFILQWLHTHQPDFQEDAIAFDADILNHSAVDLTLTIDLSETIKVHAKEDGIRFESYDDQHITTLLFSNTVVQSK